MAIRVYGNRPLKTLAGRDTRPTSSRVREAVFHLWRDRVAGCRWLDLCAGVGAMGAEALGRGASIAVGVEQSKVACQTIRHNWQRIAHEDQIVRVLRGDVRRVLERLGRGEPFDCIYFDPPYASDLYLPVLERIDRLRLLAPKGELAAEHAASRDLPDAIGNLQVCDRRTYGQTAIAIYHLATGD
ncbi:16S rRNA (guanine(966)-N(2))-methyltransferase RsmD [Synechococcus sp. PCC 7336]|uniref:16S rRNA (guanine(966)-N(2))-methyltransferase RsmD n=1 Tax=Synechococcus sp. PCC 7336 TaxID=195250 RepID=UPI0003482646|nr:16S rRNA (guanine(966)-N(2))-methyltransferase RsmD [Synechococcus sp. PCC 7336]